MRMVCTMRAFGCPRSCNPDIRWRHGDPHIEVCTTDEYRLSRSGSQSFCELCGKLLMNCLGSLPDWRMGVDRKDKDFAEPQGGTQYPGSKCSVTD
eukprot:5878872-Amphidinium_carterae.3